MIFGGSSVVFDLHSTSQNVRDGEDASLHCGLSRPNNTHYNISWLMAGVSIKNESRRFVIISITYPNQKSSLDYAHGITPKRVMRGGVRLCDLALGLHSFKGISQRWQVVSNTMFDLTSPGVKPSHTDPIETCLAVIAEELER